VTVYFLRDVVIKADTGTTALEAAKLSAYQFVNDDFVVPKVLHHDPSSDLLVLQRLRGYVGLQQVYLQARTNPDEALLVFHRVGRALARLHGHSGVEQAWVQRLLPPEAPRLDGDVLIHGDYGFSNLLVNLDAGGLAVLDPVPRHGATSSLHDWRPLDDMVTMTSCLLGRVPLPDVRFLPWIPRKQLLASFLEGYRSLRSAQVDQAALINGAASVLARYLVDSRRMPATMAARFAVFLGSGIRE